MKTLKELLIKHKALILYAFFGVCTTITNWLVYFLFYSTAQVSNVPSTIIAWGVAVAFAFVTNKLLVFNSKSFNSKTLLYETLTFLVARLATGLLDVLIMFVAVDVLTGNAMVWKFVSNVIIIILNYFFSKLMVFRKPKE